MLKSADTGLRAVPFPIEDPQRIPSQRYYDPEFYQMELDHIWPHVWQMACRLEQIPDVGDWFEYQNVGKSVIVVRTDEGVKAFHNACRHRGVPVAGGKGNDHGNCKSSGFVCPFHGWRFNMHGENTLVYGKQLFSEHQLDPKDINLIPCRVETAIGCAWINFDDDAPSFRETIGPLIDRFDAHHTDRLRAEWWYGTVLPANWKIAMEAFMEGYHVMKTHPQLYTATGDLYHNMYGAEGSDELKAPATAPTARDIIKKQFHHMELLTEGMGGMIHAKELEIARGLLDIELPDDPAQAVPMWYGRLMAEISGQLKAKGEPVPDLTTVNVSHPIKPVEFIFPHTFLLPTFTSMSGYRIRPLGPESCFFELWSLTMYPEGEEPDPVMEPTILPFDSADFPPIPRQDYANIPLQQIGLHSKGFEYMRLAESCEGMISNYQRILDGYLAGVPQEKLVKATQTLGGNFDGKLFEYDL